MIIFILIFGINDAYSMMSSKEENSKYLLASIYDKTLSSSDTNYKLIEEKKEEVQEETQVSERVQENSSLEYSPNTVETESNPDNIIVGNLSNYGPDCYGCSGRLASGWYPATQGIIYTDATYGNIRIVAGDSSLPFGTIVKIGDTGIIAIVLDRGGGIGFGKRFTFDLLFESNSVAGSNPSLWNVEFEILRYGY